MTKFTICKNIISEVQEQYEETFDIGDQALWLSLRKNASNYLSKAEIKKIPENASENLERGCQIFCVNGVRLLLRHSFLKLNTKLI